jgi:hypothetical protein
MKSLFTPSLSDLSLSYLSIFNPSTVRNGFARFLSLVGMSLIELSLDRNNFPIIGQNFMMLGQEFYHGVFLQFSYIFLDGIFPDYFTVMLFPERIFYSLRE